MPRIIWLGSALEDLQEIKNYYEEREEGLGSQLVRSIIDIDSFLSQHPYIGQVARDIKPEHRQIVRGNYLILYRVEGEVVKIAAVIDGRRNFRSAWGAKER